MFPVICLNGSVFDHFASQSTAGKQAEMWAAWVSWPSNDLALYFWALQKTCASDFQQKKKKLMLREKDAAMHHFLTNTLCW